MPRSKKVTDVSIAVVYGPGKKVTGTPWFNNSSRAKAYIRRKLKQMGVKPSQIKSIIKCEWREGDTLKTCKQKRLRSLS